MRLCSSVCWRGTGTSIAAPFVAGAITLLRSSNPTCSVASILEALQSTGEDITDEEITAQLPQVRDAHGELDTLCGPPP